MKKLITIILEVILILACVGYAGSKFGVKSLDSVDTMMVSLKSQIESEITESISQVEYLVPVEHQEEFSKVIESVGKSDQVDAMINKYSQSFLKDVASKNGATMDINAEVDQFISDNETEIKASMGNNVPEEVKSQVITEMRTKIDFEKHYKDVVEYTQKKLSPGQMEALDTVNELIVNSESYPMIAVATIAASLVLIILINIKNRFGIGYIGTALVISGITCFGLSLIMPSFVESSLVRIPFEIDASQIPYGMLKNYGYIYGGIGLVLVIISSIMSRYEVVDA